jgi:hypothetical protein
VKSELEASKIPVIEYKKRSKSTSGADQQKTTKNSAD